MSDHFPVHSSEQNVGTTPCGCQIDKINGTELYACKFKPECFLDEPAGDVEDGR